MELVLIVFGYWLAFQIAVMLLSGLVRLVKWLE